MKDKLSYLLYLAEFTQAQIICLQEIGLSQNTYVNLPGFTLISQISRQDTSNGMHGGCSIYLKNHSNIQKSVTLNVDMSTSEDCQIQKIQIGNLVVFNIYRSPSQSPLNLAKFIDFVSSINHEKFLLLGDINMRKVDWSKYTAPGIQSKFINAITSKGADNHVHGPTHYLGGSLDVSISTPNIVNYVKILDINLTFSDHAPLHINAYISKKNNIEEKSVIQHSKLDVNGFLSDLLEKNWFTFNYTQPINDVVLELARTITAAYKNNVPTKIILNDKSRPTLSHNTIKQIQIVKILEGKASNRLKIYHAKKKLNKLIEQDQYRQNLKYVQFLASSPNNIYRTFSKKTFQKKITCQRQNDGTITSDPSEVSEILSNYYASIFVKSTVPDLDWDNEDGMVISTIEITEHSIYECLKSTKSKMTLDSEGLNTKMLKTASQILSLPLTVIFRKIINTGIVPDAFRTAAVIPLAKSGDVSYAKNTRPISVESVIGKTLERLVKNEIMSKLEKLDFFYQLQYGFRKFRSSESCIFDITDRIHQDLYDKYSILCVYVDFAKCFDKVHHDKLITACFRAGIRKDVGKYLSAWLKNRTQYVRFGGFESSSVQVTSSVVQGSVLGPILFLIMSNDLSKSLKYSIPISYADDTVIYFRFKCTSELSKFYSDMKAFEQWAQSAGLYLNYDKTKILNYGRLKPEINLVMGSVPINVVDSITHLGVQFSASRGFALHREAVLQKVTRAVTAAKTMTRDAPFNVKSKVYLTYIRPIMSYSSVVWSNDKLNKQLDEQYARFFSGGKPKPSQKVPNPPSLFLMKRQLCHLRKMFLAGRLYSLANCRAPGNTATRHGQLPTITLSAVHSAWSQEHTLSFSCRTYWNAAARADRLQNEPAFNEFISHATAESQVDARNLLDLLKNGRLYSGHAKKVAFLAKLRRHSR